MDTIIREGYVKKGKVLGKTMKKKYLLLRCASQMSRTAQLEVHDDAKQVKKKSTPNSVVSMKSVTSVKRIEAPVASGANLRDGGYFIRLDIESDKAGVEELYLSVENRDMFEDWLTDLEFLIRLPELIIPLSFIPKRELPLTQQTSISKSIFGDVEFEDACPVETLETELGLKWQFNNRFFILTLTRASMTFLDPHSGLHALTYNIHNLRRCGHWQKLVFIESGRKTETGPGYLWLFVHSKILAMNFYSTLSNVMGSTHHLLVTQRFLCWDKFREELPPGSVDSISEETSARKGPVSDNDTYQISLEYIHPVSTDKPPLPPNHPSQVFSAPPPLPLPPTQPLPHKMKRRQSPSRYEDKILPPTPLDSMKRRASVPGREHSCEKEISFRADTFSGIPPIKTRYDMLVPGDTQELHVGDNGEVATKINFSNTDGKGNLIKEGLKQAQHSYYDVNDLVSKLSASKSSSSSVKKKHSLKNEPNKFNTISVVKLSDTSSKEKIGRSTFYKTSLPIDNSTIAPYAKFSDLDSQIPRDVRRERIRQLTLKQNFSTETPNCTGISPVFPATYPQTPLILYSSPQNIPVDAYYKLVDPKPRAVSSTSSLPENVGDLSIYNIPNSCLVEADYQHPFNNAEVLLPPTANEVPQVTLENTGDYDRLTPAAIFMEDSRTIDEKLAPVPDYSLYEKMESRKNISPERKEDRQENKEKDEITFAFTMPDINSYTHQQDSLNGTKIGELEIFNLVEDTGQSSCDDLIDNNCISEPVEDNVAVAQQADGSRDMSSPETLDRIQKIDCQIKEEDVMGIDNQVYETMVALSGRNTQITGDILNSEKRYQNIVPLQKPAPLTAKPVNVFRRESSPHFSTQKKPFLSKNARSFGSAHPLSCPGSTNNIYYAELDLRSEDTVITNRVHVVSPPTEYDKIDLKISNILKETVEHHREQKHN